MSPRNDYSYNAVVQEMDRRPARRQATASFTLGVVGIVIAVVAVLVAALR